MKRDMIVVGGSAGGVTALQEVVTQLPAGLEAAMLIVIHFPANAVSALPRILARRSTLSVRHAEDGEKIARGTIYVCPPNCHLVVERDVLRLLHGPRENGHRPAIDPLFRSAAVSAGDRVIAVVLSGNLNDGSAGAVAVKQAGGILMVQDPDDALHPSMPRSAAQAATADVIATPVELGRAIAGCVEGRHSKEDPVVPDETVREVAVSALEPGQLHGDAQPGVPSGLTCPECSGGLWEIDDGAMSRFRCRVGHAYTFESLVAEQGRALEGSFWAALRSLEESAAIARRGMERANADGRRRVAALFQAREKDLLRHAERLRELLIRGHLDALPVIAETEE